MKAAQISQFGGTDVIKVTTEIKKPNVAAGQVLVEVKAASLNPFDTIVREGHMQHLTNLLPFTLGGDIAGIIAEVGEGVADFKVGDKVFGQAYVGSGPSGAFAEFAVTSADRVAAMPSNLDFIEAASLPLVGVSALQALTEHIELQPSQKIFIHGVGGIGLIAIQLAKEIGAYVAATATGEQLEIAKKYGADEVIDYKAQDFVEVLKGYDAVFDTVGKDDFNKSLNVLRRGGIAVSMIAQADENKAKELGVTALSQSTHVDAKLLGQLRELVEAGKVIPQVGKVFSLDDIQDAFRTRESGAINGKVVIEISS